MNSSRLKNEGWLYWLAFLIALGFRFIQLGAAPLTDSEATLALQAFDVAQGKSPLLGPQTGYVLFTSLLFAVIESANFMARFVPAFVGSALVFVPYFFREKIKPRPALILAFFFAFDPGLVALSRQASGTILAVTFLLFAWGMWTHKRAIPAGIFAGLALLSGPSLWSGLLALGLTWVLLRGVESKPTQSPISNSQVPITEYRSALLALFSTLLLGGTLFFISPNGLSAWLSSLPEYLRGWVTPSATTPARVLFTFLAYEPLGICLAILCLIRGLWTKSAQVIRLSLWLGVSLLLAVFYRQASELVWVILPLLVLAAQELSRNFNIHPEERVEVSVVAIALTILLVYIWFNIANIALNPFDQARITTIPFLDNIGPRYVILLGASLILIVCIALVALGWSRRTARLGATWSFSLVLGFYALAGAWGASGLRTQNGVELWTQDQRPTQADLLLASVEDISRLSRGHTQSEPVTVFGIISPALEWTLRNHNVEVVSTLDSQVAPPLIITPLMGDIGLPSAYRGQDFIWRQTPLWDGLQPPDWIKWIVFRQLPKEDEMIILWARDDLFPDARENVQP